MTGEPERFWLRIWRQNGGPSPVTELLEERREQACTTAGPVCATGDATLGGSEGPP